MNDLVVLALLVVVVLVGSALCSGVEAALLSVNPLRIHELAARPRPVRGARRLAQLRQRLGRTLSVLVIANNGFNIFGSLMLGGYAAHVFGGYGVEGLALPLFSVGLTLLVMLLGPINALLFKLALALNTAVINPILSFLMVVGVISVLLAVNGAIIKGIFGAAAEVVGMAAVGLATAETAHEPREAPAPSRPVRPTVSSSSQHAFPRDAFPFPYDRAGSRAWRGGLWRACGP